MAVTPGMSGRYEIVVGPEHLGNASGFDGLAVLTDPWLTLFCEMAGHNAVNPGFEAGQASVKGNNYISDAIILDSAKPISGLGWHHLANIQVGLRTIPPVALTRRSL